MKRRDWLTIAATMALIFMAYAYAGHADEQSACRDWVAIRDRSGP